MRPEALPGLPWRWRDLSIGRAPGQLLFRHQRRQTIARAAWRGPLRVPLGSLRDSPRKNSNGGVKETAASRLTRIRVNSGVNLSQPIRSPRSTWEHDPMRPGRATG